MRGASEKDALTGGSALCGWMHVCVEEYNAGHASLQGNPLARFPFVPMRAIATFVLLVLLVAVCAVRPVRLFAQTADPTLDAACMSVSVPSTVTLGKKFTAKVVMKNTGTARWDRSAGISLFGGEVWRDASLNKSVRPGQKATFSVNATVPVQFSEGIFPATWVMAKSYQPFGKACVKSVKTVKKITAKSRSTKPPVVAAPDESAAGVLQLLANGPASAARNGNVTYVLRMKNGTSAAASVTVVGMIPYGLAVRASGWSPLCKTNEAVGQFSCDVVTLKPGEERDMTASFYVNMLKPCGESIEFQPTLTWNGGAKKAAIVKTRVNCSAGTNADLSVVAQDIGNVAKGDNLRYTFTVKNNGPAAATNARIISGVTYAYNFVASASDSRCKIVDDNAYNIECQLGTLPPGASTTVVIAQKSSQYLCPNTLSAFAQVKSDLDDPQSGNDSATAQASLQCAEAEKVDLYPSINYRSDMTGGTMETFTYSVRNEASATAYSTSLHITVPSGLLFVPAESSSTCAQQGSKVVCQMGHIPGKADVYAEVSFQAVGGNSCVPGAVTTFATIQTTSQNKYALSPLNTTITIACP